MPERRENERAYRVGKELQSYPIELAGQLEGAVQGLQAVSEPEHQHQLCEHEQQKPTLDLETRR